MRPMPYLVCVLYVQMIAEYRGISYCDSELASLRAALDQLGESIRHWLGQPANWF